MLVRCDLMPRSLGDPATFPLAFNMEGRGPQVANRRNGIRGDHDELRVGGIYQMVGKFGKLHIVKYAASHSHLCVIDDNLPMLEDGAVEHKRLVLPPLATDVRAIHRVQAVEVWTHLCE
jgi:hypothetical protein